MEDQVPFKVYTFWEENGKPEVRRFGVEKTVVSSYHYVNAKVQEVFPALKGKNYTITWRDEDDDDVTISSDDELMTALATLGGSLIKLNVYCKGEAVKDDDSDIVITAVTDGVAEAVNKAVHLGVVCDICDTAVVGFRYKCINCPDYDLCSGCEAAGHHREHCVVRLPTPNLPRAVIKAAIKRSRQFIKSVASSSEEPSKRHRRDRSGDRKHRRDGDHHGRHGDGHHGDHHRRTRISWLDTLATYMNEFANLAGDAGVSTESSKPETKKTEQPQQAKPNDETPPPTSGQSTSNIPNCPFNFQTLNAVNVQKLIEMYTGANFEEFMRNMSQAHQQNAPTTSTQTEEPGTSADVDMTQETNNNDGSTVTEEPSMQSAVSGSTETAARDISPDKAEGWTVINTEKDLMDTYVNPSAPEEANPPIGFNLPEEFQERVTINDGQHLYPPLHTATAVLNLKEPEHTSASQPTELQQPIQPQKATESQEQPVNPQQQPTQPQQQTTQPQQQTTQPQQPPTQPQQQTTQPQQRPTHPHQRPVHAQQRPIHSHHHHHFQPPPMSFYRPPYHSQPQVRPRHPKPHIDAAIQHMLAMGFTNEGGWLTQLLESKDGNIAAVLDLLTPVNPKLK